MVVCIKHWPPNYPTYNKEGHQIPVDPPSVFSVPNTFSRQVQTVTPRNITERQIDSESRSQAMEKRKEQATEQADKISSWDSLKHFCNKSGVTVIDKSESIILTEIGEIPPRMLYSLEIFKDFTVSCFWPFLGKKCEYFQIKKD